MKITPPTNTKTPRGKTLKEAITIICPTMSPLRRGVLDPYQRKGKSGVIKRRYEPAGKSWAKYGKVRGRESKKDSCERGKATGTETSTTCMILPPQQQRAFLTLGGHLLFPQEEQKGEKKEKRLWGSQPSIALSLFHLFRFLFLALFF